MLDKLDKLLRVQFSSWNWDTFYTVAAVWSDTNDNWMKIFKRLFI